MRFLIGTVTFLLLCAVAPAFAGPPLLTDDPDTPGDKHWEINLAYTLDKRPSSSTQQAPILDLNYGLGDNVQLKYELPWLIHHDQDLGTRGGVGNSNVGVKWRFLDEEKNGASVSTYPQIEFNSPTSSAARGIVAEGTSLLIPIEASKKFGPVTLNGELGYTISQYAENEWLYGFFGGVEIRENLTFLAEIHGGSTTHFERNETVFNVGAQWDFSKKYGILASAGRGFRSAATDQPDLLLYLGLQTRL